MSRKSSTETLIAAMRILARDIQSGDGVANAAIAEAADRLEEQQARIAETGKRLQALAESVQGTMKAAYCRAKPVCCGDLGPCGECCGAPNPGWDAADELAMDTLRPVYDELAAILREADHLRDATKMVSDRQLADAVNELRDIAIKYHSTQQLRERIAGVVRGLVMGESAILRDAGGGK